MSKKSIWLLLALLLGATGCSGGSSSTPVSGGTGKPTTAKSSLGMNLSGVFHYSTELPFVDAFKSASNWIPQEVASTVFDTGEPLDLDSDGWVRSLAPGQAAAVLMFSSIGDHYPQGDYVCLYDGEGELQWDFSASLKSKSAGREVVEVSPSDSGILLKLVGTNPANPLRNIRFVLPGFEATYATDIWRPGFLTRWEKFKVLRFMDWQRTNNSTVAKWSDRTLPTNHSQAVSTGVAFEYIIDLCNRTGSDPWFCIPHLADDDYVTQLASLVFNTLDSSLTVYVEYSNETWNGNFAQEAHIRQTGIDLGLAPGQATTARALYHAQRTVEIAQIFAGAFGGADRLERVLAVQSVNPRPTGIMLAHVVDSKPVSDSIDAVAVAPYIGGNLGTPANASVTANKSVDVILRDLFDEIPTFESAVLAQIQEIGNLPIDLIAYEGGQGLRGTGGAENNDQLTDKLIAVNRNPGMGPFYDFYFAMWRRVGGKLFVPFNSTLQPSRSGSWGALEFYDSQELVMGKYSSMVQFIDSNPVWW